MRIIGCDLHARQQTVAMLDTTTGEVVKMTLTHEGDHVREFYSTLPPPVRVGTQTITTTTTPRYVATVRTLKGKVWHVNAARSSVILSLENGRHQLYPISNHAKLLIGGKPKTLFDLRKGMQIEVTTVSDDTHTVIERSKTAAGESPAPSVRQPEFNMLVILQPTRLHVPARVLLATTETHAPTLPKTGTLLPLAALLGMLALGISLGLRVVRQTHRA